MIAERDSQLSCLNSRIVFLAERNQSGRNSTPKYRENNHRSKSSKVFGLSTWLSGMYHSFTPPRKSRGDL